MRRRGPLADSYWAAAALVAFALIPYLALTGAISPLSTQIARDVGLSPQALQTTDGMANAGYAFGTLLSVQLSVRMRSRRLLLVYAVFLTAASVVTAAAQDPAMFIAGHIVQGFCTSLLLIGAVPPLVIGWPVKRMPTTAGVMNLCIFGAVALGPVIGGIQAQANAWRPVFWIAAGASGIALAYVFLTWEDKPAPDPKGKWDPVSLLLAGGGCALAFFGASELTTHRMLSVIVFVPLLAGVAAVAILIAHQASLRNPLVPVKKLASTKPIVGVIAAMAAGAASVPAVTLVQEASKSLPPGHLGAMFWPFFGGAVVMAVVFGLVLRTRLLIPLVLIGLLFLAGGIAVLTGVSSDPGGLIPVGAGMIGIGVGAAVAPALFVAGYSVRVRDIQRVLALVELLRAVAAFMTAPVILHLALTVNGGAAGNGIQTGLWVCFAIAASGALVSVYLLVLGRVELQRPDIEGWQSGERDSAWDSPPLLAGVRGRSESKQPPAQEGLPT